MNSKKVKTEDMEEIATSEQDNHLHSFKVKFGSDSKKYTIDCTKPRTVLQAIKSLYNKELQSEMDKSQKKFNKGNDEKKEKIEVSEENIIIKVGEGNDSPFVATHFPCCLVEENQCLTIEIMKTAVEKRREELRVLPKENYSVFFIDKELGENSKTKGDMVFIYKNIPAKCRYFCVYGMKKSEGKTETVEKALRRDGRFVDDLTDFYLSDNKTGDLRKHTGVVDKLDGIKFMICDLPPKNPNQQEVEKQDPTQQTNHEKQEAKVSAPTSGQMKSETTSVLELAAEERVSIKTAMEELGSENINHEEINDLLRKQFPKLKEWMERRFPDHSFEETLKLKKENFGKIQNSFSEVHTVRELLELSKSICLLMIEEKNNSGLTELKKTVKGTGFILFDNFVLTNAHLFEPWVEINNWRNYLNITAEFNFDNKPGMKYQAELVCGTHDLDFALLELIQIPDLQELKEKPPGLLKIFGPVPLPVYDSGACIIGHPAGGVKKMDITCIIRKEDREQKVKETLGSFEPFIVCSINYQIKTDPYSDIRVTYNSFMYHGSSGSPVFDAVGRVFGLHSGGFFYDEVIPGHSVMEFCYPLLDVFRKLLEELQKAGREDLLKRIQEEAEGNMYLTGILESVGLKQTKDQTLYVENQRTDETGEQFIPVEEMETSSN